MSIPHKSTCRGGHVAWGSHFKRAPTCLSGFLRCHADPILRTPLPPRLAAIQLSVLSRSGNIEAEKDKVAAFRASIRQRQVVTCRVMSHRLRSFAFFGHVWDGCLLNFHVENKSKCLWSSITKSYKPRFADCTKSSFDVKDLPNGSWPMCTATMPSALFTVLTAPWQGTRNL